MKGRLFQVTVNFFTLCLSTVLSKSPRNHVFQQNVKKYKKLTVSRLFYSRCTENIDLQWVRHVYSVGSIYIHIHIIFALCRKFCLVTGHGTLCRSVEKGFCVTVTGVCPID